MDEETASKATGFLSASQLLLNKGIGNTAWDEWQQSEVTLPKSGQKYFEPSGTWLRDMQLENALKNRKKLLEIERVDRLSQLALAEWLPGIQKARVTKKSGQKWDCFGTDEKGHLYLLPEEALLLLEMNCLELSWNGMPLSIQQATEVLIKSDNSKCNQDEYRVYSQLVRWGYRLQRYKERLSLDSKPTNKRIIMNPGGLWTPNTSPTLDKQVIDDSVSLSSSEVPKSNGSAKPQQSETSPKKLGILSEETVLGSIKIIRNDSSPPQEESQDSAKQVNKWPGSRIQRNVKLMPKRTDKSNNTGNLNSCNSDTNDQSTSATTAEKRPNPDPVEAPSSKKPRPEIIELSDDEIEEIPRPMSRMDILNTLPNLGGVGKECLIAEIPRAYIPSTIKPAREFYRFERQRLLNLSQSDQLLRSNKDVVPVNNVRQNGHSSHFYSQPNQYQQAITTYEPHNGYSYRGMRCQRDTNSYYHQNISQNTIHNPFTSSMIQSNYVNFVMEVMVRSFRQQQYQQTTYCQNLQIFTPRYSAQQRFNSYSVSDYPSSSRDSYYRRGFGSGASGSQATSSSYRGRGNRYQGGDHRSSQSTYEDHQPSQPAFTKRPGVSTWSELKKRWHEEKTITIEDEEPSTDQASLASKQANSDCSEVQVVEESVSPLINSRAAAGVSSLSEVYERLRIIRSANERTLRSRKTAFTLSYEVFGCGQHFRKSSPGTPICRIYVVNTRKDPCFDPSTIQRLQQESKDVPVVIAMVSQGCISYIQLGIVDLPNLS
ncbi:hypothetical protein QAD02_018552 [Eretmocerus hayati]|uniref:Uncharacterized protein n=1 Tax=Eretmocerus hayati TaxID=131215 RepID=A0ACC2PH64_9HYME|nr:hypothetical protein QAD02_018552 [Eretmocerus hayati]